ncbi:MAG: ZIP family metal transporter [Chloroflexota bacterium]
MGRFAAALAASLVACGVTTLGIAVISRHKSLSRQHSTYFVSFAAGVLITVSFLHLVPESAEMSSSAAPFMLAGFFGLHLLNRFLNLYLCHEHACPDYAVGIIPMLGIGLHSLIDGVIYSVTFSVSTFTGVVAAVGMVFHEFPEGVITFVLLERGGFGVKRSALYAFLAAAASTPLGVLISYPVVHRVEERTLGRLLAMSAGALVYVGATHLLPEVEEQNRLRTLLPLAAGVLVGVVIVATEGHVH